MHLKDRPLFQEAVRDISIHDGLLLYLYRIPSNHFIVL